MLKEPSPIFELFKLLEILVSQESSYLSHNPVKFYSWKVLEDIDENVPGYDNHNYKPAQLKKYVPTAFSTPGFNWK